MAKTKTQTPEQPQQNDRTLAEDVRQHNKQYLQARQLVLAVFQAPDSSLRIALEIRVLEEPEKGNRYRLEKEFKMYKKERKMLRRMMVRLLNSAKD